MPEGAKILKTGDCPHRRFRVLLHFGKSPPKTGGQKVAKSVYIALFLAACAALGGTVRCPAQSRASIAGRITDARTSEPVAGAAVVLDGARLWAVSDGEGRFAIQNVDTVAVTLQCTSLGYRTQTFAITPRNGVNTCDIVLEESNLSLDEVVVTAQKRSESQTSSYLVDRHTLDHAQMFNLDHIAALLPGGKSSGDQNLASAAQRIALHAGGAGELGNASFGTAIDIDGQRIENNAVLNETKGADLRSIGSSNIESVEVVTGIPSVEYGDLSNGMVKINTRKGKSPWSVELMVEPKTRQIALSKGFAWGTGAALNINAEHTRSITALASPFTAYDRNNLNLTYSNTFRDRRGRPLKFLASLSGNLGGYDSKADPDQFQETYTKTRDYSLRGNLKLEWLLDKPWISNLSLQASASYSDRLNETNTNKSSASTQPYIHATEAGYYVGELYEENPDAAVILGPTGYWYVHASTDSKPVTYSVKAKADWSKRWSGRRSRLLAGAEFSGSGNLGRGLFYEERRTAPTWREYRYDELPFMNNAALFVEEKFSTPVGKRSSLHLTAGLRSDMTFLRGSEYGTVATLSPRVNAKYRILEGARGTVSDLAIYAGWGKAVKQPSFAVLYPAPAYSDKLAFAPGTTADGKTFYAYYTQPTPTLRNTALKWQYTIQNEIGIEATAGGTRISVSAFRNRTIHPYMSRTHYTPYTYKLTTQADIEAGCTIPSPNRQYTIDRQTGIVTVKDRTGALPDQVLGYRERNAFAGQTEYTNGSAVERRGIDVVVDFAQIRPLRTRIRFDGSYYWYKGLNETLVASTGQASASMDGTPYKYIGYYAGSSTASNGSLSSQVDANFTIVTHIPKLRLIFSVRIESSLYDYRQALSEYGDGRLRGYRLDAADDFTGTQEGGLYNRGARVAVYPEYYTAWDAPEQRIPFLQQFLWAKEHDPALFSDLSKLVVKSNTTYYFDEDRISACYAANFNLTKEIGDTASITFYARNFFCQMGKVRSSQTGLETSLFDSSRIPKFYYGLSVRLKF